MFGALIRVTRMNWLGRLAGRVNMVRRRWLLNRWWIGVVNRRRIAVMYGRFGVVHWRRVVVLVCVIAPRYSQSRRGLLG